MKKTFLILFSVLGVAGLVSAVLRPWSKDREPVR